MRPRVADHDLIEEPVGLGLEAAVVGRSRGNDHERRILTAIDDPDPQVHLTAPVRAAGWVGTREGRDSTVP